ncbi:MAG: antibiotic biosynthesis monooxygenase [Actinomycetota bacterium]|jgi:quinol monooxygenase YgiN|nr:antibiotic biosynthesis monooxygenase [Actinomycetota bacterium]
MIYITVKFPIRPEKADQFMDAAAEYTAATRAEEGNLFFEWSRSLDEPNTFVLLEGFRDADAGAAHVAGQHVKDFFGWAPDWVTAAPQIFYIDKPDLSGFGPMGEIEPRDQ